jgi:hypothetical protein
VSDILKLPRDTDPLDTHYSGWDCLTADPGSVEEARCRVCGEAMSVRRGVVGPTGLAHAMQELW